MDMSSQNQELIAKNQARALYNLMGKPVKVVSKLKNKKDKRLAWNYLSERFFSKAQIHHVFTKEIEVKKEVQLLDFDFKNILKGIDNIADHKELFVNRVVLTYEPFISRGMSGMLSILFCDFRSKQMDNILKVGFTIPVSEAAKGLTLCPGYAVSRNDPNFHKIFRFFVITAGLDLDKSSIYGKISICVHFTLSKSRIGRQPDFGSLTLVGTNQAVSMYSKERGPPLIEESDFDAIENAFKTLEQVDDGENVFRFDKMSTVLKRSLSFNPNSSSVNVGSCSRPSEVRDTEFDSNFQQEILKMKKEACESLKMKEKVEEIEKNKPVLPILKTNPSCSYNHYISDQETKSVKDVSFD